MGKRGGGSAFKRMSGLRVKCVRWGRSAEWKSTRRWKQKGKEVRSSVRVVAEIKKDTPRFKRLAWLPEHPQHEDTGSFKIKLVVRAQLQGAYLDLFGGAGAASVKRWSETRAPSQDTVKITQICAAWMNAAWAERSLTPRPCPFFFLTCVPTLCSIVQNKQKCTKCLKRESAAIKADHPGCVHVLWIQHVGRTCTCVCVCVRGHAGRDCGYVTRRAALAPGKLRHGLSRHVRSLVSGRSVSVFLWVLLCAHLRVHVCAGHTWLRVLRCNMMRPPPPATMAGDHRAMLLIRPSEQKKSDFGGCSSSSCAPAAATGGLRLTTSSRTSPASIMRGTVRQQSRSLVLMWFTCQTRIGSGKPDRAPLKLKKIKEGVDMGGGGKSQLPEGDGRMASGPPGQLGRPGGSCWQTHLSPGGHRTRWNRSLGCRDPSWPSPGNQPQPSECWQWRLFYSFFHFYPTPPPTQPIPPPHTHTAHPPHTHTHE